MSTDGSKRRCMLYVSEHASLSESSKSVISTSVVVYSSGMVVCFDQGSPRRVMNNTMQHFGRFVQVLFLLTHRFLSSNGWCEAREESSRARCEGCPHGFGSLQFLAVSSRGVEEAHELHQPVHHPLGREKGFVVSAPSLQHRSALVGQSQGHVLVR